MQELLKSYPVSIEIPIAWGDMDAFQHVNNRVYFKHFESARIAYLERINFLDVMNGTGIGAILASTQCRFKIPLTYPDLVTVGARVDTIQTDRFNMKYAVFSKQYQKMSAEGEGLIVSFDYRKTKKAPIPNAVRSRIIDLEKSVGNDVPKGLKRLFSDTPAISPK